VGAPLGVAVFLAAVWAVVPWPLARWAAATGVLFIGLAALWSWLVSRGLTVIFDSAVTRTFSGRRVDIRTALENRSPLPSGVLFIDDSSGGLETWGEPRQFAALPPWSRLRFSYLVRGRERGQRPLGPLRVLGCDPTGLFPLLRRAEPRTVIVYPPLRPVHGWPNGGIPSGDRLWEPALADDVSRFRAYREFRPGDPLSRLSSAEWARRGAPHVRVFDRTVARPVGIVVDLRAALYPLRLRWALIETAIETAASLVWESLGRGERVWLSVIDAGSDLVGPGQGWSAARPFLERLALAVPDKEGSSVPVFPTVPTRLLWVGPEVAAGYQAVHFPIEEGSHGPITHP
jgi:uncharacterized protein (DUF58 family)